MVIHCIMIPDRHSLMSCVYVERETVLHELCAEILKI